MSKISSSTVIWLMSLFLASLLFGSITVNAQGTDVTSDISIDTAWTVSGSPYLVKQDTSITSGNSLTIQAGVVVKFTGYFSLSVLGTLVVSGTPTGRVIFTYDSATPLPGSWDGIRFVATSDDATSSITSAVIQYATTSLYLGQSSPRIDDVEISHSMRKGIDLYQSSPLIRNSRIHDGLGTGIKSFGGAPTIEDNEISRNANGIELVDSNALIQRNIIKSNGIGVLMNSSSPTIIDNEITLNQEGVEADYNSYPSLQDNTFSFNTKTGFWLLGGSRADILEDTFIGNGVAVEIENSQVSIERIVVSAGGISLRAEEGSYADVWNSSLLASQENSLYLEQSSAAVLTNTSFDPGSSHIEPGCTLYVRNLLTVSVLDSIGLPLEGASVIVQNDGVDVASSLTGPFGLTDMLVVLDRTYDGNTIGDDHITMVEVEYVRKHFMENPREVDMSASVTEFFHEESPTPSVNGSQSMFLLVSLSIIVTSLVLVLLWIRKRRREEDARKSKTHRKGGKKKRSRRK